MDKLDWQHTHTPVQDNTIIQVCMVGSTNLISSRNGKETKHTLFFSFGELYWNTNTNRSTWLINLRFLPSNVCVLAHLNKGSRCFCSKCTHHHTSFILPSVLSNKCWLYLIEFIEISLRITTSRRYKHFSMCPFVH